MNFKERRDACTHMPKEKKKENLHQLGPAN